MSDPARGAAILAVAVLLTFSNTLDNAFHQDDFYRVVDNPGIQRLAAVAALHGSADDVDASS